MTEIEKIHDEVFKYLKDWSDKQHRQSLNRFFYLRTRNDERFKRGYWFPGDEKFVAISFWTGGDSLNRTSNIYFSIDPKKGIYSNLVARDSENKRLYFQKIVSQLDGYKPSKTKGIWTKRFGPYNEYFLDSLGQFINSDKQTIDKILTATLEGINEPDANLLEDEFTSKFGFISEEHFYKLVSRVESERSRIEYEKNQPKVVIDPMPLNINSFTIENFQGIKQTSVLNIPENAKWIFLTGENGFGKTSLLQALALGLTNYDENREYLREGIKIDLVYNLNSKKVFNSTSFAFTDQFQHLNDRFIAYGPLRLNTQASSSENQESKNASNIYNLFHKDGLLKNVNYLLTNSSIKKNSEFDNLRNAIIEAVDHRIIDIHIDDNGIVQYYEADDSGELLETNPLEKLATGFQGIINIIGDIISRFSKSLPGVPFKEYFGVIIIDELENHLHPIFQKKIPGLLSKIFPKIQFITSVHSPIPILGAPNYSVILKVNRDKENGIICERLDDKFELKNLNPNTILTSPIFGFKDIFPVVFNSQKDRIVTKDFYDDVQLESAVRKKLDDFLKDDK